MRYLLDTNVAIRSVLDRDPQHEVARTAMLRLATNATSLVLSAQVLGEMWSLLTRPSEARGGYGLTPLEAKARLDELATFATILPEPPDLWTKQSELLIAHRVSGLQTHDCRLAAWCLLSRVENILTFNDKDFARYGIKAINPSDV
jgi:predicted nucleic acid-binding protein